MIRSLEKKEEGRLMKNISKEIAEEGEKYQSQEERETGRQAISSPS
jgi:hypothetical protein